MVRPVDAPRRLTEGVPVTLGRSYSPPITRSQRNRARMFSRRNNAPIDETDRNRMVTRQIYRRMHMARTNSPNIEHDSMVRSHYADTRLPQHRSTKNKPRNRRLTRSSLHNDNTPEDLERILNDLRELSEEHRNLPLSAFRQDSSSEAQPGPSGVTEVRRGLSSSQQAGPSDVRGDCRMLPVYRERGLSAELPAGSSSMVNRAQFSPSYQSRGYWRPDLAPPESSSDEEQQEAGGRTKLLSRLLSRPVPRRMRFAEPYPRFPREPFIREVSPLISDSVTNECISTSSQRTIFRHPSSITPAPSSVPSASQGLSTSAGLQTRVMPRPDIPPTISAPVPDSLQSPDDSLSPSSDEQTGTTFTHVAASPATSTIPSAVAGSSVSSGTECGTQTEIVITPATSSMPSAIAGSSMSLGCDLISRPISVGKCPNKEDMGRPKSTRESARLAARRRRELVISQRRRNLSSSSEESDQDEEQSDWERDYVSTESEHEPSSDVNLTEIPPPVVPIKGKGLTHWGSSAEDSTENDSNDTTSTDSTSTVGEPVSSTTTGGTSEGSERDQGSSHSRGISRASSITKVYAQSSSANMVYDSSSSSSSSSSSTVHGAQQTPQAADDHIARVYALRKRKMLPDVPEPDCKKINVKWKKPPPLAGPCDVSSVSGSVGPSVILAGEIPSTPHAEFQTPSSSGYNTRSRRKRIRVEEDEGGGEEEEEGRGASKHRRL